MSAATDGPVTPKSTVPPNRAVPLNNTALPNSTVPPNSAVTPKSTGTQQGTAEHLVQVEDLTVRVAGRSGAPILDSVSFTVEPGKMTALVGESGAGKSMTTKAVLGILDERLFKVGGHIVVAGRDVSAMRAGARRRYTSGVMSLVFQNPTKALNPTMRVGPQIAEALRFSAAGEHRSAKEAEARAVELMRQVGIAAPGERYHAYPHQMSGGMKQRAVIAIALSMNPRVLLADEPTSSLDVTTQALIMDLLDELRERLGIGILFITHDLVLAASRADDVLVLHSGRVVENMPVRGIFASAAMPYTRDLIARVPGVAEPVDGAPGTGAPGPVRAGGVESAAGAPGAPGSAWAGVGEPVDGEPAAGGLGITELAIEGPGAGVLAPARPAPVPLAASPGASACRYVDQCAFRQAVCAERVPPLAPVAPGHLVRCWFPVGHPPLARDPGPDATAAVATTPQKGA